jgi:hypothetical protein
MMLLIVLNLGHCSQWVFSVHAISLSATREVIRRIGRKNGSEPESQAA